MVLSDKEYPVDVTLPPAFFFPTYLEGRLPPGWITKQQGLPKSERHPIVDWLEDFQTFLSNFKPGQPIQEHKKNLTAKSKSLFLMAYDMYSLDGHASLQDSLVNRLTSAPHFQGALHELGVAATTMRAGFDIEFEDETDSTKKHPEFVATHKISRQQIAVEAKSVHRRGLMGAKIGNSHPTAEAATAQKIALQICGQVEKAIPKAGELPFYLFVDLNLHPSIIENLATDVLVELRSTLPLVDSGVDKFGRVVGRTMNLLVVTNRPMQFTEASHTGGEMLNMFITPDPQDCRFPLGSNHIPDVKLAVSNYGTIPDD